MCERPTEPAESATAAYAGDTHTRMDQTLRKWTENEE
eukprot:COSAG01_NODE_1896_length_8969_cov_35.725028_5_plen_37_part_00